MQQEQREGKGFALSAKFEPTKNCLKSDQLDCMPMAAAAGAGDGWQLALNMTNVETYYEGTPVRPSASV